MSLNVSNKKRRPTVSDSLASHHLQLSQLDFSNAASPLLLVAAAAAAAAQQRQLLHQQLQHQQEQHQQLKRLEEAKQAAEKNRNTPPTSVWQQSSPPTQIPLHKIRKLKLYSVDEKIDIIDYAKVIGNRAAGREFNVAESSIREWRKNEDRLRKQSEGSANGAQRFETHYVELIRDLDNLLVEFVDSSADVDWYGIRDKARELWPSIIKDSELEKSEHEMQITMGWVTRFMKRNEDRVRRIAPPVIATANAANSHNGSLTMVRKASPFSGIELITDKTLTSSHSTSSNPSPCSSTSPSPAMPSRRKCLQPRRAVDPTLVLTPDKEKNILIEEENKDDDVSPTKRPRRDDEQQSEKGSIDPVEPVIEVC